MRSMVEFGRIIDTKLIQFMNNYSSLIIRLSLGIIFVWFGILKVAGRSPVETLVMETVYWTNDTRVIVFLGCAEVIIGTGLLFKVLLRTVLFLFWIELMGTFSVLFILPHIAFQERNVFLLTTEGEFVIKNLALIAAGMAIGGNLCSQRICASNKLRRDSHGT